MSEQWKKLTEPVALLTVVSAVAVWLGAVEGLEAWVSLVAGGIVVACGAAVRQVVTPLARPQDADGNTLTPE